RDLQRVEREHVAVDALVVPRRTRAVVTEVVARHLLVAGKPPRVIVDSLPGAARRLRPGFAARRHAARKLPAPDGKRARRQIDQYPVEEIDTGQRRGHAASFLVDVVPARWTVGARSVPA